MKTIYFTILSLFLWNAVFAQKQADPAVRQILATQQAAWNRGDINNFMVGYWENDSLLFVGKTGPKYGYTTTLNNYKKNYPDTATMGKLHFDILQVKPLGNDDCFVLGKWFLKRSVGNVGGMFTLLFHRFKNGWKIVADHSS